MTELSVDRVEKAIACVLPAIKAMIATLEQGKQHEDNVSPEVCVIVCNPVRFPAYNACEFPNFMFEGAIIRPDVMCYNKKKESARSIACICWRGQCSSEELESIRKEPMPRGAEAVYENGLVVACASGYGKIADIWIAQLIAHTCRVACVLEL